MFSVIFVKLNYPYFSAEIMLILTKKNKEAKDWGGKELELL
jgi:hypothetical protein